jgi:hypothetical protein
MEVKTQTKFSNIIMALRGSNRLRNRLRNRFSNFIVAKRNKKVNRITEELHYLKDIIFHTTVGYKTNPSNMKADI